MEKRLILIFLFLLCGCEKRKTAACSRYNDDDSLTLYISAIGDDISGIAVQEVFVLPDELLYNEEFRQSFEKQLDSSCQIEDGKLIRRYNLALGTAYSFSATIKELQKEHFFCD